MVNGRGRPGSIAVVGINPDEAADQDGKPFVGYAGQLLGYLCEAAGVPNSALWLTNATRCASPKGRRPTDAELAACRPYLINELQAVAPQVILTMGEAPLTTLRGMDGPAVLANVEEERTYTLGLSAWEYETTEWAAARAESGKAPMRDGTRWLKPKKPVKPHKPKVHKTALKDIVGQTVAQQDTGLPLVPTFHPRYLMRGNWDETAMVIEHIKKAWRICLGEQEVGELGTYGVVRTKKAMHALVDYLLSDSVDTIYFDTETTGLHWQDDELLCISFAGRRGEGYVVPILHNVGGVLLSFWGKALAKIIKMLRKLFASSKAKCGHNMLFDTRFLERQADQPWITAGTAFGIRVEGPLRDTELQHHAIAETLPHNMTSILAIHTDMPYYEDELHAASSGKKLMAKVPNDILWKYSAADADGLPRMEEALMPIARDEGVDWVLENVTYPMLRVCRNMEDRGIPIDQDYFDRLCAYYGEEMEEQQEAMYAAFPKLGRFRWWYSGNPNEGRSKGDLKDILFNQLKMKPTELQTKGAKECEVCTKSHTCERHQSVGAAALKLMQQAKPHPLLPMLLNLKTLTKVKTTYLDGGKGGWKKHIKRDGRIHPSAKINKVETGRLAFADPSVQNPPKGIVIDSVKYNIHSKNAFRDIVRAPKGKAILNVDWNQLEVWVLAYTLALKYGDDTMLNILLSGEDIHTKVARFIWPGEDDDLPDWEWRKLHGDKRSKAKTFVFGLAYGLTLQGIIDRLGCTEDEGKHLLARYMAFVPGLKAYFADIRAQVNDHGWTQNWFGRRRHSPEAILMRAMQRFNDLEGLMRQHINFGIQSGGSDLHSVASALVDNPAVSTVAEALTKRGVYAILSVHDSLTFEADWPDNEYMLQTSWMIKNLFEGVAKNLILADGSRLAWQTVVECEWGQTWGTPEWKLDAQGKLEDLRDTPETDPDPDFEDEDDDPDEEELAHPVLSQRKAA